ncbi:MAG: ATP-binding protein [Flavobacteriales bacterium]
MSESGKDKGMHRLLERQLRKFHPDYPDIPEWMNPFLEAVSESYQHYDNDRLLMERAMKIGSDELWEKKRELLAITEQQSSVLASLRDVLAQLNPEGDGVHHQDLNAMVDSLQDEISKRHLAESQRTQSEERMLGIVSDLNLGMAEYDLKGNLRAVQPRFAEIFHCEVEDMIGKNESYFQRVQIENPSDQLFRFSFARESFEAPFFTKDGQLIWLLCSTSPVYSATHQISGGVMVVFDITARKQMESELIEARTAAEAGLEVRKSILANVSHELRTPVNAIVGMSSLLANTTLDSEQSAFVQTLKFSSDGLIVLIDDLLDVSRIESGKMELESIPFSMREVFNAVQKLHENRAQEKGIEFISNLDETMHQYYLGDPHRLSQVLNNLVGNAIKFTQKGFIKVEAHCLVNEAQEQIVEIRVEDSGIGISHERQQAVFLEFSQEDSSTTRRYGGTGLGLTISRKLVDLMGGELTVKSEKGVGTTFQFSVRLMKTNEPEVKTTDEAMDLHGMNILLVEDNEINQYLANVLLESWNAEVDTCLNGEEALNKLREHTYDLVLMDLQMPILDGFDATLKIRTELKLEVPILALTANALSGERDRCLQLGMNGYVSKPFQPERLYQEIRVYLPAAKSL